MALVLTKEQQKINDHNHRLAIKHFESTGELPMDREPYSYCLHHKDESLRENNIERYILWLFEDLEVRPYGEHTSHHKKDKPGVPWTEERKKEYGEKYSGENNAFFGHKHTEESLKIMSEKKKGEKNPMYGKNAYANKTEEEMTIIKKKMSDAKKDYVPWNKGKKCKVVDGKRMYY